MATKEVEGDIFLLRHRPTTILQCPSTRTFFFLAKFLPHLESYRILCTFKLVSLWSESCQNKCLSSIFLWVTVDHSQNPPVRTTLTIFLTFADKSLIWHYCPCNHIENWRHPSKILFFLESFSCSLYFFILVKVKPWAVRNSYSDDVLL